MVCHFKTNMMPAVAQWLVWLSGLSTGLRTKGLLVRFPVRHMSGLWARSPAGGVQAATTQ